MRRSQRGFTLLEMLVAIAITGLLITAAVQTHVQILRAQREKIYERGRDVTAERVVDRIERELLSALLVAKPQDTPRENHPWVFQGTDGGSGPGQGDSIRFVTYNTGRGGSAATALRVVSYAAERGAEERMELFREEVPLPAGLPETRRRPEEGAASLRGVELFQLRYRSEKSGAWVEQWDSTKEDELPSAVEVTLQLTEPNEAGEIVAGTPIQRVIPLLVRPVSSVQGAKRCEVGISIEQCLPALEAFLGGLDPQEREDLTPLIEAASEECILDTPTPEAVVELSEALAEAGGGSFSLASACQGAGGQQ